MVSCDDIKKSKVADPPPYAYEDAQHALLNAIADVSICGRSLLDYDDSTRLFRAVQNLTQVGRYLCSTAK